MRKLLTLLFAFLSSVVFSQEADTTGIKKDSVPATPWVLYHAIEARLDTVLDDDQSDRRKLDEFSRLHNTRKLDSLWEVIGKKDDINLAKVKAVLDKYGWLGINEIGEKANLALFIVIQHADSLTQMTYLPMMRQAVKDGKAKADHLALLEDRVLTNQGKPQMYGSQVRTNRSGKNEFFPIADERNVNKRRTSVGLEPLEIYARNFGIDYHLSK